MKIGDWVVYDEVSGLEGFTPPDCDPDIEVYSFPTKRAAIECIHYSVMRMNRKPKVERLDTGFYAYKIRSVDTGRYDDEHFIVKLTAENIGSFRKEYELIQMESAGG